MEDHLKHAHNPIKETLCMKDHLKHVHNPIKETFCMEDHLKHVHNPIKETLCMEDHLKHAHNPIKPTRWKNLYPVSPMSEYNEFKPRLKSLWKPVSIERRLKSWNILNNFKRNQPYLSHGLNSLNSASVS